MYSCAPPGAGVVPAAAHSGAAHAAIATSAATAMILYIRSLRVGEAVSSEAVALVFLHGDGDLLRIHRRRVRHVIVIAENQLQRMLARWQLDARVRLTRAEVQMVAIRGYLLIERRQVGVDQQMVMAGVR